MRKYQKEQAENFIQLLGEAHEEIRTNIEKKNYEPVLVTLADCQDGAIALGNLIETAEGENCTTIPLLEKYCELVFQIHTDISNGDYVDALKTDKSLRKALTQIENRVRNDIKVRKEIVFFPYNASMWDSLESVYLATKEDPDCDVYCVPIPYFEKRADGKLGQAHYEGAEYPKNIEITDWQTYNFEERRPDVMYIHNPYDASNRVTCVHPRFFSSNLKKYTDELVYIPYFVGPEIDPKDQAAIERMKHFCFLPGVIHADKVILQSENHRQVYIAEYSKAAKQFGLEAKHTDPEYLEEKFLALGSPKFDKVLRTKKEDIDIPDEWISVIKKPDGSFKKIIFYNTSIQALLIHKEQMLKKMKYVLETFKENKDEVALLWRPHPLLESTIKSMLPRLWEEYDALTRKYREEGWGIWDDTKDMNRAVALSDAYYGDSSSVLQVYQKTGKPVMVQNVDWEYDSIKLNIEDGKIIGNELWMIAAESNYLFSLNMLTDEMEKYKIPINSKEIGNYRAMEEVENKLYLIPSKSNELLSFDLCTKEFKVITLKGNGFFASIRYQKFLFLFGTFEPIVNRINIDDDTVERLENIVTESIEIFESNESFFRRQVAIADDRLYIPFCNANAVLEIEPIGFQYRVYVLGTEREGYSGICYNDGEFWLSPRKNGCVVRWNKKSGQIERIKGVDKTDNLRYSYLGIVIRNNKKILAPMYSLEKCFSSNEAIVELQGEYNFLNENGDVLVAYEKLSGNIEAYDKELSLLWKKRMRFSRNDVYKIIDNVLKGINVEGSTSDLYTMLEILVQ